LNQRLSKTNLSKRERLFVIQKIVSLTAPIIKNYRQTEFPHKYRIGNILDGLFFYTITAAHNLIYSLLVLFNILFLWRLTKPHDKFNLFFGISKNQSAHLSNDQLLNFISEKRFDLNLGPETIVEARSVRLKKKSNKLIWTRDIHIYLIKYLSLNSRFKLVLQILKYHFLILKSAYNCFEIIATYKELVFEMQIAKELLGSNLIGTLINTNSSYSFQDSFFHLTFDAKPHDSCMFWYSDNSVNKPIFNNSIASFDQSLFEEMKIKKHFVWADSHARYLKKFTEHEISIVGSQLLYPRPKNISRIKEFDFIIFDVTPFASSSSIDFYSEARMMGFIKDIMDALAYPEFSSFKGGVKPKRLHTDKHSRKYVRLINNSFGPNHKYILFTPDSELYELIAKSRCVIGVPFTSPVVIAKELRVPSCYYIGDDKVILPKKYNNIPVLRNKQELLSFLQSSLLNGR